MIYTDESLLWDIIWPRQKGGGYTQPDSFDHLMQELSPRKTFASEIVHLLLLQLLLKRWARGESCSIPCLLFNLSCMRDNAGKWTVAPNPTLLNISDSETKILPFTFSSGWEGFGGGGCWSGSVAIRPSHRWVDFPRWIRVSIAPTNIFYSSTTSNTPTSNPSPSPSSSPSASSSTTPGCKLTRWYQGEE